MVINLQELFNDRKVLVWLFMIKFSWEEASPHPTHPTESLTVLKICTSSSPVATSAIFPPVSNFMNLCASHSDPLLSYYLFPCQHRGLSAHKSVFFVLLFKDILYQVLYLRSYLNINRKFNFMSKGERY